MSRFFRGDDSDSDSEEGSSSEEETTNKQQPKAPARYESSDDSDDQPAKRVVQSQQAKLAQEYDALITKIKQHTKTNECTALQGDVDKLDKSLQKSTIKGEPIPRSYFKALVLLEEYITKATESGTKLNGVNQKAFTTFKQRFKKHNTPYAKQISEYKEKPDKDDKDSDSEGIDDGSDSDESSGSDEEKKPVAKKAAAKPAAKPAAEPAPAPAAGAKYGRGFFTKAAGAESSDSDDDEDNSGMDDSDDDDDDDSSDDGANKWKLKAPKKEDKADKKDDKKDDKDKKDKKEKKKLEDKPQAPAVVKEMTAEQVDKKLSELLSMRGKRGTDKQEQVESLELLVQFAKSDAQLMSILMHLVSALFDATPTVATHMPVNLWKGALTNLTRIVTILKSNPTLVLAESEEIEPAVEGSEEPQVVVGNLLAYVERLDDEFIRGLQNIDDPHTHEYVQRLQDEQGFINLTESVQAYYARLKDPKRAARAAFRRLEHLYYKTDKEATALAKSTTITKPTDATPQPNGTATPSSDSTSTPSETTPAPSTPTETPASTSAPTEAPASSPTEVVSSSSDPSHSLLIHDLAIIIYAHGDERLRARAMLMHIFHHALHDRFYEARDMMLMSHLQESIHQMDIPTQILFNRTMVQLGLCAFRSNLIWEAHSCLADICGVSRVKELLAQGVTTRFQDKDKNVEQEKLEKKRQVPFHMHINLELLEVVHLISAMLLEVPNMAANPFDPKRKVISRNFRRLIDYFDRQVFTGPPENNRDHVAAAAKALNAGDWKTTERLLLSLEAWALMPNVEGVKTNVRRRIQDEGLRTYLFNYATVYDSISLAELSSMFELDKNHVHSIVSKMMINEELKASWDQPTETIVMHKIEPSKLQYLALQFAEKAAIFAENNERLLDAKQGNQQGKDGQQGKQNQQGQDRRQDRPWQDGGGYRRQYGNQYQQKGHGGRDGRDNKERGDRDNKQKGDGYSTFQTVRGHRGDGGHRDGGHRGDGGHRDGGHREGGHRGGHDGGHRGGHDGGHRGGFHRNN